MDWYPDLSSHRYWHDDVRMLRKVRAAADMLVHSGPRAVLREARVRYARAVAGRSVGDHFAEFGAYVHADGQRIPLYAGYRDYLKPLHVLAHATERGVERYLRDNRQSHVEAAGLAGAAGFLALLRKMSVGIAGRRILDVGCGDGALAFLLASHGAIVTGVELETRPQSWDADYRGALVAAIARNPAAGSSDAARIAARVELMTMDIQEAASNEEFDLIVSNSVLEHIHDLRQGLANMRRLLASGGTMIHLFNPFFSENGGHEWCILDFPWGHVRLSRSEFAEYLEAYRGWEVDRALDSYDHSFNDPKLTLAEVDAAAADLGLRCTFGHERRSCWWEPDTPAERILAQSRRNYPRITWRDLTAESVLRVWRAA